MIPTACYCQKDNGAGYTYQDENGNCDVCKGHSCDSCNEMCEYCGGFAAELHADYCTFALSVVKAWSQGDFSCVLCRCCREELMQDLAVFVVDREFNSPMHWLLVS